MSAPTIVTSSFSTKLPPSFARICIARGAPRWEPSILRYAPLAPGKWYKTVDEIEYRKLYFGEILGKLDPNKVVEDLKAKGLGRPVAILCWEAPQKWEDWCHRGYVSQWLHSEIGLEVPEYGMEEHGIGVAHPKIPKRYRVRVEAPVQDRSAEILPHVGKMFRSGKAAFQVKGVSEEFPDQAEVTDGRRVTTITVETLLTKLGLPAT